ncbi:MAG: hypothetical protein BGO98_04050 [Myxococcales bacterium 68-20]|nr:MAG: hypothetical protein BGO98_04050 [Myxococcales bacterium 68-20]
MLWTELDARSRIRAGGELGPCKRAPLWTLAATRGRPGHIPRSRSLRFTVLRSRARMAPIFAIPGVRALHAMTHAPP